MSRAASKYERLAGDKYYTPRWPVEALLSAERFDGAVWDPAAGAGDILAAFPVGTFVYGSDVEPDAPHIQRSDFLAEQVCLAPNIITNPPYGTGNRLAVQFIERALDLTQPLGGKVAMLLKVDFDSAKTRRHLFADHPAFAAKYVLTRRVRWANVPQMAAGPTENHAWFLWDWRKRAVAGATIHYLPIIEGASDEHARGERRLPSAA